MTRLFLYTSLALHDAMKNKSVVYSFLVLNQSTYIHYYLPAKCKFKLGTYICLFKIDLSITLYRNVVCDCDLLCHRQESLTHRRLGNSYLALFCMKKREVQLMRIDSRTYKYKCCYITLANKRHLF